MTNTKQNVIKNSSITLKAFNNPKCSDVVFIVNNTKYYAYRNLVANTSPYFQTLLAGEFKESSQKEIELNNIMKYEDNFLVILTYIHGFEIDLKKLDKLQVSELFYLTGYFDLTSLGKSVENYLINLELCDFDFDSATTLLNIASSNSYDKLYENVQKFIFLNAQEYLNHQSFLELEYNVLTDFLKSNSFYADKFAILIGVLKWYDSNAYLEDEITESETNEKNAEKNGKESTSEDEGFVKMSPTAELNTEKKTDNGMLKDLLRLICPPEVNLFKFYKTLKDQNVLNIFSKYQTELCDVPNGSEKCNVMEKVYSPLVFDFIVQDIDRKQDGSVKSEVFLAKNMKWKLKVKWSCQTNGLNVYLTCASSKENWQCTSLCDIRFVTTSLTLDANYFLRYEKYTFTPENNAIYKVPFVSLTELKTTYRASYIFPDGSCKLKVTIHPKDPIFK